MRYSLLRKQYYIGFVATLSVIVGLRPIGFDRDSSQYASAINGGVFDFQWLEPTFYLIVVVNDILGFDGTWLVFTVYCFFGLLLKVYAFPKLTPFPFYSFILYLFSFFLLLEVTQIRAGVAIGFLFLGFGLLISGRPFWSLFNIILAASFHYSAIIGLFVFIFWKIRNSFFLLSLLPILGFVTSVFLTVENVAFLVPELVAEKVAFYLDNPGPGISLFSPYRVTLLMCFYAFLLLWRRSDNHQLGFLVTLHGMSIFLFYAFCNLSPVFSVRFSGLISPVLILLIPFIHKFFKPNRYCIIVSVLFVSMSILYLVVYLQIFSLS